MYKVADWRVCSFGDERIYFKGEVTENNERRMMFDTTRTIEDKDNPKSVVSAVSIGVLFKGREFRGVEINDREKPLTVRFDSSFRLIADESLEKNSEDMRLARDYEEKLRGSTLDIMRVVQKATFGMILKPKELFFSLAEQTKENSGSKKAAEEDEKVVIQTKRYSFRDKGEFYYLAKNRLHENELEAWREIGRVIERDGSVSRIDAQLIFMEMSGEGRVVAKRSFPNRIRYLVENGALNEREVVEEILKEKVKRVRE